MAVTQESLWNLSPYIESCRTTQKCASYWRTEPTHRHYVGVPATGEGDDSYLFVEIDRVTVLELERGEVGLFAILSERAIGLVFESTDFIRTEEVPARPAEVTS